MIVQPDFLTHWKTKRLINSLNQIHAPLYVLRLWAFCQTSRRDRVPNDPETIKAICDYDGDAKVFFKALIGSEYLEIENDAQCIAHGWAELNKALIHNWEVGRTGGRPKGSKSNNPRETQGLASENPRKTLGEPIRVDKSREDIIPPTAGAFDENEAMREICRLGYGWEDDGSHKHKLDEIRHAAYFRVAVAFMVRGGVGLVLKPETFSTYVHSHFGKMDDPQTFFDLQDDKSLPRYAIARIADATDNDIAKYGARLFEFYVKDFNRIYGMENDAAFKKHRAKQIEIQNRRAER
jgi:hypothetical protein